MFSNTASEVATKVATASVAMVVAMPVHTLPLPPSNTIEDREPLSCTETSVPDISTMPRVLPSDDPRALLQKLVEQWQLTMIEDQKLFYDLHKEWRRATALSSDPMQAIIAKPYQRIIGMGQRALPFIFGELPKCLDNWFWALEVITGENPVRPEHYSSFKLAVQDWMRWGKEHGFHC